MSYDQLLEKDTVVAYLAKTKTRLSRSDERKEESVLKLIYTIGEVIGDSRCCITNWVEISQYYRWSYCLLRQALQFFDDVEYRKTEEYLEKLEVAHQAAEPFVIDHLKGKNVEAMAKELGFL